MGIRSLFGLISILWLATLVSFPFIVNANVAPLDPLCQGYTVGDQDAPEVCKEHWETRGETSQEGSVIGLSATVVNVLLIGIGIAGVFGVLVGGFYYITSGGDPQKITRARNVIIYSLVGVVVAAVSQAVIFFVIGELPW